MDEQRLLDEFPVYLEKHRLASGLHIPYLTRWVRRYLAGPYEVSQPSDRLLVFLDRLRRDPRIADWQVRQAEEAVRLFRLFAGSHQAVLADDAELVGNPRDVVQHVEPPPAASGVETGSGWGVANSARSRQGTE